jgi:hypothetical protein
VLDEEDEEAAPAAGEVLQAAQAALLMMVQDEQAEEALQGIAPSQCFFGPAQRSFWHILSKGGGGFANIPGHGMAESHILMPWKHVFWLVQNCLAPQGVFMTGRGLF